MKHALGVAVDARDLASDTRGIGRYTRAILRRLLQRDDLEFTLLVRDPFPFRHRRRLRDALGSDRFRVSNRAGRCDVIWHPANGTFFPSKARSVVTIHDAVPFRFPEQDPIRREHQQAPFLRSTASAARVIAVSAFDRAELIDVFRLPPQRIETIYHGVERFFSPEPDSGEATSGEPYLLFVGDPVAEPRKNFALLLEAYRNAFDGNGKPRLVVVGARNPNIDGVHYAGVAGQGGDEMLRRLYRGALALCVPSYYETFGMPVIEAMACGTPVIAAQASCLPEIGGDAARYVPPHDAAAWSAALREISSRPDLRGRLREAGIARAARYDWDESARRHADVLIGI